MTLKSLTPNPDHTLSIETNDGTKGVFNVKPYLDLEVFQDLKDLNEFLKVKNGLYYVEWESGADLSLDTILARMKVV